MVSRVCIPTQERGNEGTSKIKADKTLKEQIQQIESKLGLSIV